MLLRVQKIGKVFVHARLRPALLSSGGDGKHCRVCG